MKDVFNRSAWTDASECARNSSSTQLMTQNPLTTPTSSTAVSNSASSPAPPRKQSILDSATPAAEVSAFCRAVLSKIIPNDFLGSTKDHNQEVLMQNIDRFVNLRRFESLSLHEVIQGMEVPRKVKDDRFHCTWLMSNR